VALSRLVRPSPISLRYAARVWLTCEGVLSKVIPAGIIGPAAQAFVSGTDDHLSTKELRKVGDLWKQYSSSPLPEWTSKVFWYCEYAARLREVDVRHVLVVTAVEALLYTHGLQRNFVQRSVCLASMLGVDGYGTKMARDAYRMRCSLSHAGKIGRPIPTASAVHSRTESVLRAALKRCISDRSFAERFASKEAVADLLDGTGA